MLQLWLESSVVMAVLPVCINLLIYFNEIFSN